MSEVSSYKPGTFCWVDLGTNDADAAKKFYSELFGWEVVETPTDGEMNYTMLKKNGKDAAALYQMSPDMMAQGIPPFWMNYVSVENANTSADKAKELGGTVVMEAMDVMDVGRMAMVQDPSGATVALWEPKAHHGASIVNEPGSICWNELASRNSEAAGTFYKGLFDWGAKVQNMGPAGDYTTFMNGEDMAGGMMQMNDQWPAEVPSHWMPYFAVEDCDASASKAKELGAQVVVEPQDIPGVGRFSVLIDPQGAAFSIIKLTMAPQS